MSTKTERNQKYVAHDEKSKFSIFRPEVPYGRSRNVMSFFVEKLFLNFQKIKKTFTALRVSTRGSQWG